MYNNYDVEMRSRNFNSAVEDAHRQRKLEADARRQRAAQATPASKTRRLSLFAALRLRLERAFQPAEESLIA
jgi:hypothetical protein